jgi:hypothetical protein
MYELRSYSHYPNVPYLMALSIPSRNSSLLPTGQFPGLTRKAYPNKAQSLFKNPSDFRPLYTYAIIPTS